MKEINNQDLLVIAGGFSITGVIIKEATNLLRFVYNTGQAFGSSLRRMSGNNLCPLR